MEGIDDQVSLDQESAVPAENVREHERILKEIETTDTAFVGASLRAIYEGSYHESFMRKLDHRIKQHDRDIERLCNFHYQGFIESITELIKVRGDAEGLKNQVKTVNNEQQESGKLLSRKSEDLIQCRLQQRNIASAIDELTMCLPVLQTYGKMQDQLKAGRHYSALKTLEKLEHIYFPSVHKYRYYEIMIENVPKIREEVRANSITELRNFLEVVRTKSSAVGKIAMNQVELERSFKPVNASTARQNSHSDHEAVKSSNAKTKSKKTVNIANHETRNRPNPFDQLTNGHDDSLNPFEETNKSDGNPFEESQEQTSLSDTSNQDLQTMAERDDSSDPINSKIGEKDKTNPDEAGKESVLQAVQLPDDEQTVQLPGDETAAPPVAPPRRKKKKVKKMAPKPPDESAPVVTSDHKNPSENKVTEFPTIDPQPLEVILPTENGVVDVVAEVNVEKPELNFVEPNPPMPTLNRLDDVAISDLIDFSPVYKCMHIFGILKYRQQFEKYYRSQRTTQATITCQPPNNMHENLQSYMSYFHQIVGFFIVEDYILHTANDLIDQAYITGLWNMALSQIISVLRTDSDYCDDADTLMAVKNLIVVFADTLKAYGFVVDQLFSFLIEMREQYSEILLKKWSGTLQKIFDEDNYTPMQVNSETEAIDLLALFPMEVLGRMNTSGYPKVLPFSQFVPCVFNEIKRFVRACLEYCADLHLSSTEIDDVIRKSTNLLLTRTLSTELQKLVQKPQLGLTELVQITINISYLENLCKYVEEYVCSITGVHTPASHAAKLVGVSTFKDARSETESRIYMRVNSKIDEFFELADYNWAMSEAQGTASSYLLDLIAYLKNNFKVFTNLPEKVAQTACMSACKHIGSKLMETLLEVDARQKITMAALQQYSLDVMQCELFANSEPVPGFQDGVLQMSFLQIRQLLDLFLSWDWSSYLADRESPDSKYLRVGPATALSLLERIKDDGKRWNILTSFNRMEREKKRLLETVLKQLRNIVNAQTS